jgi:hypothetical protein
VVIEPESQLSRALLLETQILKGGEGKGRNDVVCGRRRR